MSMTSKFSVMDSKAKLEFTSINYSKSGNAIPAAPITHYHKKTLAYLYTVLRKS